jgi:hypothetical protein
MSYKETVVLIAGLGRFYGAGRRIFGKLRGLYSDITPIIINDDRLREIAIKYSINPEIFNQNIRGYGYWQWKPLLVYHFMKQEGVRYVVYLDAGCDIEPWGFLQFVRWFTNIEYKLLLSRTGHNITRYTKPEVITTVLPNSGLCLGEVEMLQAGIILLKIDSNIKEIFSKSVEFLRAEKHYLFDDSLACANEKPEEFVDHRNDQSILTLLILGSRFISEVGILPSTLTPPRHLDWSTRPPIIASRNQSSLSFYNLLLRYGTTQEFPRYLNFCLRALNKIARLLGYPFFLLSFFDRLMEILCKSTGYEGSGPVDLQGMKVLSAPIKLLK